ncbi:DMT family transporter [Parafrankia elaeagni]|uniref:DMT family transporter n=1 Tax=Parafrankia elaeagni TaxID=222534 RepID=UPI00037454BC|nr:DMT family transporter [Parafrankia elaeagni]
MSVREPAANRPDQSTRPPRVRRDARTAHAPRRWSPGAGSTVPLLVLVTLAGSLVSVQARLNGELGVRMHSALAATTVSFAVAAGLTTGVVLALRPRAALRRLRSTGTRWWYWTGGLAGVSAATANAAGAPRVGVSLVSVCAAAGLVAGGLTADRIGFGPSGRHPVTRTRVGGAALAIGAVLLATSDGLGNGGNLPILALLVAGGFVAGLQQPVNGRLSMAVGTPLVASLASFYVGLVAALVILAVTHPALAWPTDVWLYTGGVIAAIYVCAATTVVARLGALGVSMATIAGQLIGAAALDLVMPVSGRHLTVSTVLGAIVALVGTAVASLRPRGQRPPAPEQNVDAEGGQDHSATDTAGSGQVPEQSGGRGIPLTR